MKVRKIKPKVNKLEQLKLLNKTLLNNKLDHTIFTNDTQFQKYYIYKIISLLESNLKVCWYLNEYMNELYDYYKMDNEDLFTTFQRIISMSEMNSGNFYYSKYQQNSIEEIIGIFRNYLKEININFNEQDLIALYNLYKRQIITNENIIDIKLKLNMISEDDIETIQIPKSIPNIKTSTSSANDCKLIMNSEEINKLNENIINYINNRTICQKCSLFNNKKIILDTNLQSPGPVDIIFIGLNADKEDNRPFIGKTNQHVRNFINTMLNNVSNFKYMITNSILCLPNNETELKNSNTILSNCDSVVKEIIKLFTPYKLLIIFGDKVSKHFKIQDPIKKASGNVYFNNIMPIIHPSAIEKSPSNLPILESGFKSAIKFLIQNQDILIKHEQKEVKNEKMVISDTMTLFDVKHINNKIIYIFFDSETQEKKYIIDDIKFPVYIKKGQYRECDYITNKVDAFIEINEEQRSKLMYTLRSNLTKLCGQ